MLAVGLAVPAALPPGEGRLAPLATGAGAVVLLAASLAAGWAAPIPWALGLLATGQVVARFVGGAAPDPLLAVIAAGLLATGELAYWSLDARVTGRDGAEVHLQRGRRVLVVAVGGAGLSLVGLTASTFPRPDGPVLIAGAIVAAVTALGIVVVLLWRAGGRPSA